MSLVSHALSELQRVFDDEDLIMCYIEIVSAFDAKAGSGEDINPDILVKLFNREHLGELSNDPKEWHYLGGNEWQSLRNERAISDDGGRTYWVLVEDSDEDPIRCVSAQMTEKGEAT